MTLGLKHLLLAGSCLVANMPIGAQDLVVRIGHVGPLSGALAHYGKDNENGARMAIDDLNAKGVTIGGRRVKFELVAEDDAADPKQGAAAARKLCDARVAGVVGHMNSGTSIAASPVYSQCGIPHITPAATSSILTTQGFKTTFRLQASDSALGVGLALHAADNLKLKKVAIVTDRTAYGQGIADAFASAAKSRGIEIVDQQYTTDKSTDFSSILTAVKSKQPDALFYGGVEPQAGPMLRQMEQLGLSNVKVLGSDGICTENLADLSGGAKTLSNVVCAERTASLTKIPGGAAWKARYDAKYPKQFQVYSPYAYDSTMALAQAMIEAGSTDPKIYTAKLAAIRYGGITGNISFGSDGDLARPTLTLYGYQSGRKFETGTFAACAEGTRWCEKLKRCTSTECK